MLTVNQQYELTSDSKTSLLIAAHINSRQAIEKFADLAFGAEFVTGSMPDLRLAQLMTDEKNAVSILARTAVPSWPEAKEKARYFADLIVEDRAQVDDEDLIEMLLSIANT
ncbi:hypothetical protein ACI2JN_25080 [Ochrobactrum teleogrylli]|uniref:hypothetical protein n=1 Tax=Ochrobactrum teleogrylli TaxID=2479765 RepID=UPI00384A820E